MIDLNQVNVIDNFIPTSFQEYLYKKYTKHYSWTIGNLEGDKTFGYNKLSRQTLIYENNNIENNIQENFQFGNKTLDVNENFFNPEDPDLFFLLHYLQLHLSYKYKIIPIRLKVNLQTVLPLADSNKHASPHVDLYDYNPYNYTLIYYVNDSDGDTIIFNEKYEGSPIKNFTINKKINPQKGKAILFPTNQFHASSSPINTRGRIVINCNFQLIPL